MVMAERMTRARKVHQRKKMASAESPAVIRKRPKYHKPLCLRVTYSSASQEMSFCACAM